MNPRAGVPPTDAMAEMLAWMIHKPYGSYFQCRVCLHTWWGDGKYLDRGESHDPTCFVPRLSAGAVPPSREDATEPVAWQGGAILPNGQTRWQGDIFNEEDAKANVERGLIDIYRPLYAAPSVGAPAPQEETP